MDGLVERFELQAALCREQVRHLTTGEDDGHGVDEVARLEADLRTLRQGPGEGLTENERPTVPAAGVLQPR